MTETPLSKQRFHEAVELRLATVDDLSQVRKLKTAAFNAFASCEHTPEEAAAILAQIDAPGASDRMRHQTLHTAWYQGTLVAAAGWRLSDDSGRTARLGSLAVHPLFGYLGLGRLIVGCAEGSARKAGFPDVIVHAQAATEGFFSRLGFQTTAHGVRSFGGQDVRITYMRKRLTKPLARDIHDEVAAEAEAHMEARMTAAGAAPGHVLHAPVR